MKFAIGSDFHVDINERYPFNLQSDKDAFYLCAGDIAGDPNYRVNWLREQEKRGYHGIFVLGNHQVYDHNSQGISAQHDNLKFLFDNANNGFRFLENNLVFNQTENILIIGCTLWTDFALHKMPIISGLFNNVAMCDYLFKCIPDGKNLRRMRWRDTVGFFNQSVQYITDMINIHKQMSPGVRVVLVTHHAPSKKSLRPFAFSGAAYASNLDKLILSNPEIKLWVHGHLHYSCDYNIGNCRVISNPRGYINQEGENKKFNKNLIVELLENNKVITR